MKHFFFALISLLLCACGPSSSFDEPNCLPGQACLMKLSLDLSGLKTKGQIVKLNLKAMNADSVAQDKGLNFECSTPLCDVSLRQSNFPRGFYELIANDAQGRFLGAGVIDVDATSQTGRITQETKLDMETTGYYAARWLVKDLSVNDGFNLVNQLDKLTGDFSDMGEEMNALGTYFIAHGAGDAGQQPNIITKLNQDISQDIAPYHDGIADPSDLEIAGRYIGPAIAAVAPIATGVDASAATGSKGVVKLVTGPLGFAASMVLREFMKSDAFAGDPMQASLHLFKVMLGMSTDFAKITASGGAMRSAITEIRKDLANQFAAIQGLSTELNNFRAKYDADVSVATSNSFTKSVNAIAQTNQLLDNLSDDNAGCITPALPVKDRSIREYIDLFATQPQDTGSRVQRVYDKDCLRKALSQHLKIDKLVELRTVFETLTGDNGYISTMGQVAANIKAEVVKYPNAVQAGRAEARVRPLSESYAIYNELLVHYLARLGEATAMYANVIDTVFYVRERFPEWRQNFVQAESLSRNITAPYLNMALPDANACHDAKGVYVNLDLLEPTLAERCRFEMIMAYRAKKVSEVQPLQFTSDTDLLKVLPNGSWRDYCKVDGLNIPGGPVVLDFDGVNLWTLCSADDKQKNLPASKWNVTTKKYYTFTSRNFSGEQVNCSALRQVHDYRDKVWPGSANGGDDTGSVAIACSPQPLLSDILPRKVNYSVSHINLARCGLEGSNAAKIGVNDGILQCQDQYNDGNHWNKFKLRINASDEATGLLSVGLTPSGTIGFTLAAEDYSMLLTSDISTSVDWRGSTDFGRNIGGKREVNNNGRSIIFTMSDVTKYRDENIGDFLVSEMRYNKTLEVPLSDLMRASFKTVNDNFEVFNTSKSLPLLIYRKFAIGAGNRMESFLFVPKNRGFSHYLRCTGDDSGCQNAYGFENDSYFGDKNAFTELRFKNLFWGKILLKRNPFYYKKAIVGFEDEGGPNGQNYSRTVNLLIR